MATYSIVEAQERLPDLLQRAAQGEEVVVKGEFGLQVTFQPVPRVPGPMTEEDLAWLDSVRVRPAPGAPSGPELVRRMRDEGH